MKRRNSHRSRSGLEEHYRSLFDELAASGQSLRAFARQRGLSAWTLYGWRRRLGLSRLRKARDPPTPRLLEVDVRPTNGAPGGGMVLHLFGRHRVELAPGFAEDELRRIVRALSSC